MLPFQGDWHPAFPVRAGIQISSYRHLAAESRQVFCFSRTDLFDPQAVGLIIKPVEGWLQELVELSAAVGRIAFT
jgi:hypothetical protein